MLMTAPVAAQQRPPPSAVKILLPVWGERFVAHFLEFCLPTLLAPGNIPALARMLPCEIVLMTRGADEEMIYRHPLWPHLTGICSVTFSRIDDLITDGNHSTTITLAYARMVRETGERMLDTCFFFLVSDYLVADGSLRTVLARILDGASGVLAGNFQVVAEDAADSLRQWLDPSPAPIALPPRKLLRWALSHLHPATVANIVNYRLSHNAHTNRLFWRVDENTLIGRFYLMHMIGIRPEVTDFVVGSSCDYSFIPEMCPSGNVVALEDSDDYLVIEMQPRDHEARHLRWGPISPKFLAESLVEWTTKDHRQNIRHTLVYHAAEVPDGVGDAITEADTFLAKVGTNLTAAPQPHRDHPYWLGAIAAHRAATGQRLSPHEWAFVLGGTDDRRRTLSRFLWQVRRIFYGYVPNVRPWHPQWPDFRLPLAALREPIDAAGDLLIVSDAPDTYRHWLWRMGKPGRSVELNRLLNMPEAELGTSTGHYGGCLLVMTEGGMRNADKCIKRIVSLLQPAASLFILVINDRLTDAPAFAAGFAYHSARFVNLSMWVAETSYVRSGPVRWALRRRLVQLGRRATTLQWYHVPYLVIAGGLLSVLNCLLNVMGTRATVEPPRRGFCSSMFLVLRPQVNLRSPASPPEAEEAEGEQPKVADLLQKDLMDGTRSSECRG
jgi:hypothetical protein